MRKFSIIILFFVAAMLTGCEQGYCPDKQAETSLNEIKKAARLWDDKISIANSASRIALAGPISDLQDIRRDTEDLEVPVCLAKTKRDMVNYMDYTIDGFIAFMADDDRKTNSNLTIAGNYKDNFQEDIAILEQCMPNCTEEKMKELR